MIRITNIKLPLTYHDGMLTDTAAKALGIEKSAIACVSLFKRSVDARRKSNVHFTAALDVVTKKDERSVLARCKNIHANIVQPYSYPLPAKSHASFRPVIVGAGPAGLFAALIFAQCGASPIVLERGSDVERRSKDIKRFWDGGILAVNSNVQFGEGGAGTFSDGKLNTGTKDIRARKVLQELVKAGAPEEILYNAKPHIGSDKLPGVVKNIRKQILSLGGTFLFDTQLEDLFIKNDRIAGVFIVKNGKTEQIPAQALVLAIGHSARDTFAMLKNRRIAMEQKPFSVGVRIEHLRAAIDRAQYGASAGMGRLGAADYKLAVHLPNGRGVYTFCMCPGGFVVAAASEEGGVVTNGMSNFARDAINSNSALLVGIDPSDFQSSDVLAGVYYQRRLEEKAFLAGGGHSFAPVQRVCDFLQKRSSSFFGSVLPSYRPGTQFADLHTLFPDYVAQSLAGGLCAMKNKLDGFADGDALLTGVETRSSSPVRILRDESMQSRNVKGLYPCGEGAGYAGGIISAAVDGIKCAEAVLKNEEIR